MTAHPRAARASDADMASRTHKLESRVAALEELLDTLERTTIEQSELIERSREAESHLAAIVQSSDDAIVSVSPDYRMMSWNKGAERLFGWVAEEALGQRVVDLFVTPETRVAVDAQVRKDFAALARQPHFLRRTEMEMQHKDGSRFQASLVACSLLDQAGRVLGISLVVSDVTERQRAANEQLMLATIVNASEDAIVSTSLDNSITSWNHGAERLFGISANAALGRKILEFLPPAEHVRTAAALSELSRTRKPVNLRQHSLKRDGTQFDCWVNLFPIYDSSGKMTAVAAIGRDITDQVKIQDEQASLATIVNASQDAILALSREMRITSWNRGAEIKYGHAAAEAIGQGLDFFVPPEELAPAIAAINHLLDAGEPVTWEQRTRDKHGTSLITLTNIFPIRNAEGKIVEVGGIGRDITRFKQIEAELREAHEYTRGLIESSVDAMVIVDPDMRISDGNEQLARLTELPKKVLFGSRFDSHFSEPALARAAVEKALADGYVTNVDLTLMAASGTEVPVSFNASLFYRAGKVFGIFGVARDVTVERATERTLREEREYSHSLVQSSPDALLVSDVALVLTDVNERALELTCYRREELLGSKLTALFTEPLHALEVLEQTRDAGPVHDIELLLLTRNAEEIPVALNASAFHHGDGTSRRVVVAVRDVSESKRAQKANSLLASIVDSSGDAIYSLTPDLIVTSWNLGAERLYGFMAHEMLGRNVALLVPLERRSDLAERAQRIRHGRKAEQYETVSIRKDGSTVEVALTVSPILDTAGAVTALSATARDISERKRLEAEFLKARDAALEGARLKSEFLANMSHEIRTPLNSIIGMSGLLLDTELSPEQAEFAHDVRESGDALLSLVNDILDFSKIAAGKFNFEEIDFELTGALEGAVELVASQTRHKGLELTLSVEPEVPRFLRGDPGRLRQVLLNLLSNAVKFTVHGEIAVVVSKLSESPKEAVLRVEVRDSGIGIPPDKLHLLFQPFSQVDASTSRQYGGTGLGLSIVRELVERMGGTVAVTSTPGTGSTFWFTITLTKQVDISRPASERFVSLSGARVLIVDDNANSRRIIEALVTSWGMKSATAAGGAEALTMLHRAAQAATPYQVALLDVMMPELDGIELARLIKTDPALAATAVIFISSVGSRKELKGRLQGLEICGWLMKPVPESALYDGLVKVLADGHPATTQAAATSPCASVSQFGGAHRVLLAEDNPINQKVARLQLKKLGLEVDVAANGREAVEAMMRLPYDVILMDCQMPEMDGYEATREIRRREAGASHVTIVALTAHALPEDRAKCLAAGMDGYISKPVTLEALQRALAEVLAAKPRSRRANGASARLSPPTPPAIKEAANGPASLSQEDTSD
jgi:PAS domain S-box-containing protein